MASKVRLNFVIYSQNAIKWFLYDLPTCPTDYLLKERTRRSQCQDKKALLSSRKQKDRRIGGFTLTTGSQAYVTIQRLSVLGKNSGLGCATYQLSDLGQMT